MNHPFCFESCSSLSLRRIPFSLNLWLSPSEVSDLSDMETIRRENSTERSLDLLCMKRRIEKRVDENRINQIFFIFELNPWCQRVIPTENTMQQLFPAMWQSVTFNKPWRDLTWCSSSWHKEWWYLLHSYIIFKNDIVWVISIFNAVRKRQFFLSRRLVKPLMAFTCRQLKLMNRCLRKHYMVTIKRRKRKNAFFFTTRY